MKVGIFADNIRQVDEIPPIIDKWISVKNDKEFREEIVKLYQEYRVLPVLVSLDHDCHEEHMEFYFSNPKGTPIPYENFKEKTFLHSVKWLYETASVNKIQPSFKVFIHSENPIGSRNIELLSNKYKREAGLPEDAVQHTWKYKDLDENNENYKKYLEIKEKYHNFE